MTTVTASPRTFLPLARNVVERIDRRYRSSLSTDPVLDEAGDLLHAWCVTAVERGTDMSGEYPGNDWAERLAVVALEMASHRVREPRPRTPQEVSALLDAVVTRLAKRGIRTSREESFVSLPRASTTPAWDTSTAHRLAINLGVGCGWELAVDQPASSPVVALIGRCDHAGIDAMLDLALIVNSGAYGDIFRR